jgi:Flp pilus assembly pilin Flp
MRKTEVEPRRGAAARPVGYGLLAVLVSVAMTAAACSSSNSASTTSTTTTTLDTAAAPGLIAQAYETLFNFSDKTVASKVAVIQNGSVVQASLQEALNSPLSSASTGSKIDSTTVLTKADCTTAHLPSPCAKVTYDLLGANGSPVLAGQTGYAVYVDGSWLVAKVTICALLGLFYSAEQKQGAPPGC